ncbi:MAG: GntG family PLP-dependent aldolase [bacterium]
MSHSREKHPDPAPAGTPLPRGPVIDLRSDTVTRPGEEMRRSMAEAEVGDDVYGEDPTVNLLQEELAGMLGKEAALFMASGTMSNQVAINTHTRPGDEVICHRWAHVFNFEGGTAPAMSGVGFNLLDGPLGLITADQVEEAVRPDSIHYPTTALISIENTHNKAGGTVFPLGEVRKIRKAADRHGLPMHLDGARLFNASVATRIDVRLWAEPFDSISICLSKGLGAPAGSVLVGSREFIRMALQVRKRFGGAMRQVGVLAAAGRYALQHNIGRLAEDHARARRLAEGLDAMQGCSVDMEAVQTNIVFVDTSGTGLSETEVSRALKARGVLINPMGRDTLRAVTHLDVDDEGIETALDAFSRMVEDAGAAG